MALVALMVATTVGASACSSGSDTTLAAPVESPNAAAAPPSRAPSRASSAPAVEGAPLTRAVPVRLRIPAIGVDSALMDLGLLPDGSLQVPPSGFPAGWYTGGPTPGELGPAVIAGHIDWHGPGVFFKLHELKPGDLVIVRRADGSQPTFRISRVALYPKDHFPTALVYGNLDHAGLRLITCGGSFNSQTGHYRDNIVAFADLVTPTTR
jgi:sortase (surface protein transpeptidase)